MTPYYDRAGITLYHADYRDVLEHITEYVDLVLADPPYNVTPLNGRDGTTEGKVRRADGSHRPVRKAFGEWDRDYDVSDFLGAVYPLMRERAGLLAFTSDRLLGEYMRGPFVHQRVIVWHKTNPSPQFNKTYQASAEFCVWQGVGGLPLFTGDGATSCVLEGPIVPPGQRHHDNEKPLWLVKKLIANHSEAGQLILDPFAGSGTTLVAAKALGRAAIGVEIDERHCETIVERLSQDVLPLFGAA